MRAAAVRRDQKLVEHFVCGYNEATGDTYEVEERPEELHRQKPAVEAVAQNQRGSRLAIEHTLLQPFEGQKEDDPSFLAVFGSLENDPTLAVPNYMIDLHVRVGAIPNGVRRQEARRRVYEWFKNTRDSLPEGASEHAVPNLPFPLRIHIEKTRMDAYAGNVFVDRFLPDNRQFVDVVRRALGDKVPKLAGTAADKRILLVEKGTPARGYVEIGDAIESLRQEFPQLEKVDAVWAVSTVAMEREHWVSFCRVWPGGLGERFRARC
jgi:hypothetical protein